MDRQDALKRLNETAHITCLIEELLDGVQSRPLSRSSVAGLRVLLKNIHETIVVSSQLLEQSAQPAAVENKGCCQPTVQPPAALNESSPLSDPARLQMKRRDLRASLEKIIEGDLPR